jgi:hypothetical protein
MFARKFTTGFISVILTISILAGCGKSTPTVDPSAKITEIASTVQAELTSIALLTPSATATLQQTATSTSAPVTPTPTGVTPTPTKGVFATGVAGDNAKYLNDVTIPDYSLIAPSTSFVKTWLIQNTGTTTWTKDYKLIYLDGIVGSNNAVSVNLPKSVAPGETVEISVNFISPAANGVYSSYWKMYTATGYIFGEILIMYITVGTSTLTPTAATGTVAPTTSVTP